MNNLLMILKSNYETIIYIAVAILLLLAVIKPEIQLKQEVHNYLLIADVSQSMNAEDTQLNNKNVSRMAYTRQLMTKIVETSPCGTYISVGVFASNNVALLITPLEVCANYDVLNDTIAHIEWRMAWKGDSRLTVGVRAAAHLFDSLNVPAKLLFFTDGDEAPKLNVTIRQNLDGVQIGTHTLFVGIGGDKHVPVPRYNSANKWIGYWPSGENNTTGGGVNYADTSLDDPDPVVAYAEYDQYLTKLEAEHLQDLAAEIKAQYIKGTNTPEFYELVQQQKPAASFVTAYSVRWVYLLLAALLIITTYIPNALAKRQA